MKYCPYCGASLLDGAVSFCSECGKQLPKSQSGETEEPKKTVSEPASENTDTLHIPDYDGYYDDILPEDETVIRRGIDKSLIKKIALLAAGVCVVIALSILAMYFL